MSETNQPNQPLKKKKRRIFWALLFFTFLYAGIVTRLAWIQVFTTRSFSSHHIDLVENAIEQRREKLVLNTSRGMIYDRNELPLTGEEYTGLAVFPFVRYSLGDQSKIEKLASILDIDRQEVSRTLSNVKHAGFWKSPDGKNLVLNKNEIKEIKSLNLPGVIPLPVADRYPENGTANQVIGFIGQNPELIKKLYQSELKSGTLRESSKIGITGLERTFQAFLGGIGEKSVSYYVDGNGNPLGGLDIRLQEPQNSYYPLSITTTLDSSIQKKTEEIFDQSPVKKGAAVILDINTREVLGMVSRPNFSPNAPDKNKAGWQNQALKQMAPGSVFKIVVAAAALEEGLVKPTDHFFCQGKYGKYGFSCWKEGGHGDISFEDAFAQSCNITFGEVAKKVGAQKLQQYALNLGLVQPNGWEKMPFFKMGNFHQFDQEDAGQIFVPGTPANDEGVLMQTGIGQRDVQITPLQAANMAATIAADGKKEKVRIVQSINYQNGTSFYRFEDRPLDGAEISPQTARTLRRFMEKVVDDGTATNLKSCKWTVAGKSGTAQTMVGGEQRNNQWFVGFTPRENPKYAIAIVAEDQPTTGSSQATKMFGSLVNFLAEHK
ncbi:peptidoglycan D,D-transpeptidase FtsI family protein [Aneurinibacillus terranovensis]|uniref:peptidoglycan D,D-transpeptidase FtsI family protein n=1 Tax=Aneurinibacillus terranovensis TaxID=278991 RepID=UPI00040FCB50|nr:penicillin-binding protein 2 [Aneurinibacillus terranovensis]